MNDGDQRDSSRDSSGEERARYRSTPSMRAQSGVVDEPVCHSDTARSNRHGRAVASTAAVVRDVVPTTQLQITHQTGVIPRLRMC